MSTDKVIDTCKSKNWSSLQRPRFSAGLLLEDEDLNVGVKYTHELMRLMLKSFFGCGVVCGLDVTVTKTCHDTKRKIEVARGVAVDCAGDLIDVSAPWSCEFGPDCDGDDYPGIIWVVLCYTERCCRPRDAACSDDDGQSQPTRIQSGYEIYLYKDTVPGCACRCPTRTDPKNPDTESHGCCHEHRKSAGQEAGHDRAAQPTDPCDCYKAHYDGVCECDSACKCVVLAKVDPREATETHDMVRRVRPLLRGYVDCFVEKKKEVVTKSDDPRQEVVRTEHAMKQAEADYQARKAEYEAAKKAEADAAKAAKAKEKEKEKEIK